MHFPYILGYSNSSLTLLGGAFIYNYFEPGQIIEYRVNGVKDNHWTIGRLHHISNNIAFIDKPLYFPSSDSNHTKWSASNEHGHFWYKVPIYKAHIRNIAIVQNTK